jgi:hypothetical protein
MVTFIEMSVYVLFILTTQFWIVDPPVTGVCSRFIHMNCSPLSCLFRCKNNAKELEKLAGADPMF